MMSFRKLPYNFVRITELEGEEVSSLSDHFALMKFVRQLQDFKI